MNTEEKQVAEMTTSELEQLLKQKKEAEKQIVSNNKKALEELQDEFIDKFINHLFDKHNSVSELIKEMFADFEIMKPLKAEVRGVDIDKQYSHTITKTTKDMAITIGYNNTPSFDGTETEGITIIKNYLNTLAEDNPKLVLANKIINILLKTNPKTGELNVSKAMELNELRGDFHSQEFNKGMDMLLAARYNKITSSFVQGWQNKEVNGRIEILKFRFSI
jgi:hypothetical protein